MDIEQEVFNYGNICVGPYWWDGCKICLKCLWFKKKKKKEKAINKEQAIKTWTWNGRRSKWSIYEKKRKLFNTNVKTSPDHFVCTNDDPNINLSASCQLSSLARCQDLMSDHEVKITCTRTVRFFLYWTINSM